MAWFYSLLCLFISVVCLVAMVLCSGEIPVDDGFAFVVAQQERDDLQMLLSVACGAFLFISVMTAIIAGTTGTTTDDDEDEDQTD